MEVLQRPIPPLTQPWNSTKYLGQFDSEYDLPDQTIMHLQEHKQAHQRATARHPEGWNLARLVESAETYYLSQQAEIIGYKWPTSILYPPKIRIR
jgi:hypothetical protein